MARPKPNVLLEKIDRKSYRSEQVLEAGAIYAVYYKGKPINLRSQHSLKDYPGPKYKKTSYQNPAHALNLAQRLNEEFNTTSFQVYVLVDGQPYEPDKEN